MSTGITDPAAVVAHADGLHDIGRRDLPTATIIARLDPQRDRPLWLALRRTGIGSSDMAAVLGMSRYRSELDVYQDKVGDTPLDSDDAGEAARWGNLLEDIVAREWAERHGVTVQRVGTVAHVDRRHLLCDLDRLVRGCPDHKRCALEVKTRSAWKADEWRDGALPDDVEAQVMQQLAVTGLDAIHVAALVGGQKLESRLVNPDPDYIADMFAIADQFWTENVTAGVPPAISSLTLLEEHLKRLTPDKGTPAVLDTEQVAEVEELTEGILIAERVAAGLDGMKARLKAIIGEDATDVILPDPADPEKMAPWWTFRSQAKPERLDTEALEADLPPGRTLADYKVPNGTTRVLNKGAAVKRMAADA